MLENEWLECGDPYTMLRTIVDRISGRQKHLINRISDRKLRLFACACCRLLQNDMTQSDYHSIDLAERWSNGEDCFNELYDTMSRSRHIVISSLYAVDASIPAFNATRLCNEEASSSFADALRCIAGNHYRIIQIPGGTCSACAGVGVMMVMIICQRCHGIGIECPWITPTVLSLAQAIYDERETKLEQCPHCRRTGRYCHECYGTTKRHVCTGKLDRTKMAILADAIEEAGCNVGKVLEYKDSACNYWYNELYGKDWPHLTPDRAAVHPIIAHLRDDKCHFMGCWVIDLILGYK